MDCLEEDLVFYMDTLLQKNTFRDIAINGLQVSGKSKIAKIATAVTASTYAIEQAVQEKADALIVHHGLFLYNQSRSIQGSLKQKLQLLLENGLSLFCYHLPLDAHQDFGNNWPAAKKLDWHNLKPFGLYDGIYLGVQGHFSKRPIESFLQELTRFYGVEPRMALGGKKEVSSAALISGGSHKCMQEAILAGVDCFITGTGDEPNWHMAFEEKIHFLSFGHAATEKLGIILLGEHLKEKFSLDHFFIDQQNPF